MVYKPSKEDLAKLKDSKPVPVCAHSHEVIVPVVYSGLVNRFLESKGIKLPLTHHQLAKMKHEAGVSGYAKGTHDLKINVHVHNNQTVLPEKKVKRRRKQTVPSVPGMKQAPLMPIQSLYNSLRPNNYDLIRQAVRSTYSAPTQIPDYAKEEKRALEVQHKAISKLEDEMKHKVNRKMLPDDFYYDDLEMEHFPNDLFKKEARLSQLVPPPNQPLRKPSSPLVTGI